MTDERRQEIDIEVEMINFVKNNNIYYIADLWCYCEQKRSGDWFPVLRKRDVYRHMKFYLKERREASRRAGKRVPPPENSWHD